VSPPDSLFRRAAAAAAALSIAASGAAAQRPAVVDMATMPLDALLDLEVTGPSRSAQRMSDAAASVTVITADEIRALGYRTIADALRSVRGVAISDDHTYSYIGVRGFYATGDYNTRVLLLVDGNRVNDNLYDQAYVGGDAPIVPHEYYIAVKEVPVGTGSLRPNCVYVNDSAENIRVFGIEGENVNNPADLRPGSWIPADQRHIAETAGLKVWEPADVILLHLSRIMRRYAHDFIGIQEAQGYLDFVSRAMPKLVEETIGKVVTIHQFTDVLQRLVQEGISIRDTKSILDALSEWGRIEKDPVMLTEHIRAAMRRYISFRYALGSDTLFVYLLDPEIEDVIRSAIRRTSTGSFLSLDPTIAHDILDAIRREIADRPPTAQQPVIVTDMELRRFVRKMVELEFSNLAVLSYQELTPELNIQPIGRISMRSMNNDFASFENEFAELPEGLMPTLSN